MIRDHSRLWACAFPVFALWLAAGGLQSFAAQSLRGRVLDPQGSGVAAAKLTLATSARSFRREAISDENGDFAFQEVDPGNYILTAEATAFITVSEAIKVASGPAVQADIQFLQLAEQKDEVTVVAFAPEVLTPDPGRKILSHDEVLEANPGRPGAPISIPGLPIETASGGLKAGQYFAPGVAGDHGEPIAQYYQLGDFLLPNNLPANAHGNGYADPNFLISRGIGMVEADAGAFNVREGNHAVDLGVAYGPSPRLEPFFQLTGDYRDADLVTGWSPSNPATQGWLALEASFGNGYLQRLEHRQQYKLNAYRLLQLGQHQLTVLGIGYWGFSRIPGLIPIDTPVPEDTLDSRQLDRTHSSIAAATDTWNFADHQKLIFSGFFRTYSLDLRSNFGEGLIKQSEFRTVAGGNASYLYRLRAPITLLAGVDIRRDAPRDLDLQRADQHGVFLPVTRNDVTLGFLAPFVSIDGPLTRYLHYDLGVRQEEVQMDNLDKMNPAQSFHKTQGFTLPKGTLTIVPPRQDYLPTVAFSFGEAFHTNDPRIGAGGKPPTVVVGSRAYQLVARKEIKSTDFRIKLARVASSSQLAKIDPDTGLQMDVGPSLIHSLTVSIERYFRFGSLQASWARADAHDRINRQPIPEAPRLIWDAVGTVNRLPLHLRAQGEFEYVGRRPLGDGFTSVRVREIRGALLRSFADGRMDLGVNFLRAAGFTGQTTEVLALPADAAPFERIVGVPLKSYVTLTWTYNFRRNEVPRTQGH
jgi:carboxypeptidase family protein